MDTFKILNMPDSFANGSGTIKFWFVSCDYDNEYYLHTDLIIRKSCYNSDTQSLSGHFNTEEDANKHRLAYYKQYGLDILGNIVGSEDANMNTGSRELDL